MYLLNGVPQIQKFGYVPNGVEKLRATEIYIILLAAFVCLQLTEIVFWKYAAGLETIEAPSGEGVVNVRVSSRHKQFVDASMAHFMKVISSSGRIFEVGA